MNLKLLTKRSTHRKSLWIAVLLSTCLMLNSSFAFAKATIIYVYSDHCRMCDVFAERILNDKEVQEELKRFNFEKVHASSPKVNVEVTPTIIVYNEKKKIIEQYVPSLKKKVFLDKLRKIK